MSAQKLAEVEECSYYRLVAEKLRCRAVHGVRRSLETFSGRNADAVLSASILLSWQPVDHSSFASFTCGTASVIETIQEGRSTLFLADIVSNSFSCASNIQMNQGIEVPKPPIERSEQRMFDIMKEPLNELWEHLSGRCRPSVESLLAVCQSLQDPLARTNLSHRFSILGPAMWHILWLPTLMTGSPSDKWALVLMAYWYAMVMSLQPVRYAPVSQLLRSSCMSPVRSIFEEVHKLPEGRERRRLLQLMELPVMVTNDMQEQIEKHEREVRSIGPWSGSKSGFTEKQSERL